MPPKKKKNDIKAEKAKNKKEEKQDITKKSKDKKDDVSKSVTKGKAAKKDPSPEPPVKGRGKNRKRQPTPEPQTKKKVKSESKTKTKVEVKVDIKDKADVTVKIDTDKPKQQTVVKVITKGGVAVDTLVPKKQDFRVFQQNGKCYAATLNQANMDNNNNKFYIVQVLVNEKTGAMHVWNRWGRVGVPGQNCLKGPFPKQVALKDYNSKVHDKTVKGDYKEIQIKYDDQQVKKQQKKTNKPKKINTVASKIDAGLQKLINLIFDTKLMDTTMKQIGYDAKKMPLGKLGDNTIKQAYSVLNKLSKQIKGSSKNQQLSKLSGQFFTLIPHDFGFQRMSNFIIRNQEQVKEKLRMLEAISDMKITTKLLDKQQDDNTALIDQNYQKLGCKIKTLDQSGPEFRLIKDYFDNTKCGHNRVTCGDIYEIQRQSQMKNYNKKIGNNMLLWHGSRITNFVGILSQGLRIAPPEAPVSGYLFGKGIYLADLAEKSIHYCRSHGSDKALILLIQGAIGNPNILKSSSHQAKQLMEANKKDSTKCWGAKAPPQSCYVQHKGMTIPNGAPVPTGSGSYMGHNQYIVYQMNQARIRYIIEMNMNGS